MQVTKTAGEIRKIKDPVKKEKARARNKEIIAIKKAHPFYLERFEHYKNKKFTPAQSSKKALKALNAKYEHLNQSQNASITSFNLIREGKWKTEGKVGAGVYEGIWGVLGKFNMVDAATGKINNSGMSRWAENLEMAKDIYEVREDGSMVTLYDHISKNALNNGEGFKIKAVIEYSKMFKTTKNNMYSVGEFDPLNNKELIKNARETDKMMKLIRNPKDKKGISGWDFDDT